MSLTNLAALLIILTPLAQSSALPAGPRRAASAAHTTAAQAFFQRDWVLMNWALRFFDANGDIALSPKEAAAAAAAFRKLADIDRDGRITPTEYRLARHYILTRN